MTEDRAIPAGGDRGRDAIMAFMGAGLFQRPSPAQAVDALAAGCREVASCRAHGESVRQWLAGEVHHRGIRENAAVLAVLEIPSFRHEAARAYALDHPDRQPVLEDMLCPRLSAASAHACYAC
jgi:hypothetical protein